jgi:putative membrane protein
MVGPFTANGDVKNLAVEIATENIVGSTDLEAAAKSVGVELPTKLDDARQKQYEAFKDYKGDSRDREFVKEMVRNYTLGVTLFTLASKEATDPAVKEFAAKALPRLRKQLEAAKSLDK